jgi:hypothetical protein
MEIFVELIKIVLPAGLVLWGMYLTVSGFLKKELVQKDLDIKADYAKTLLPIRLQAYERMTLFLERISPNNLLLRLNGTATTAREFQQVLNTEIRDEYSHNLSQQIYMSHEAWESVSNAREQVLILVNTAASEVPSDASAMDLAKKIFEKVIEQNTNPTEAALRLLKEEVRREFM